MPNRLRRVDDVCIAEQHELGRLCPCLDGGEALLHRPELTSPARRHARASDDANAIGDADSLRHRSGGRCRSVRALVVHDHNGKVPGIILPQERGEASPDHVHLIARRHDCYDARPSSRRELQLIFGNGTINGIVAFRAAPEPSSTE
jgi:hypothetical protein